MVGKVVEGTLWFNSSKEAMKSKLTGTKQNSGVGIHIGRNRGYINPNIQHISLRFDDGSTGQALVKKDSWGNCTHLIDECIGLWARNNGLWKLKLISRTVKVYLQMASASEVWVSAEQQGDRVNKNSQESLAGR